MSETDRELLEYAAKAAGVELKYDTFGQGPNAAREYCYWNPLTDDGDAFRLSVSLRLPVVYFHNYPPHEPSRVVISRGKGVVENVEDGDWMRSTRRAIVRAAAEIGRRMESDEKDQ
jgi:hypothetical protein